MSAFLKKGAESVAKKKSIEEQLEYQKQLNNITNRIHSATDTNDILLNLQVEILVLFDADRITVYAVDGVKKEIVSRFKTGDEINEIRVPIDNGSIAGYCAKSAKVVNILDVYDENELRGINPQLRFDKSWDQRTGYKTTQVLVAPITYNRNLFGVIQLINKSGGKGFTEEDQSSALDIANVLGIAFFKNQKAAQKSKPAKFDWLITNNIISSEDLAKAMSGARKAKKPVESVLVSDFNVSKDDIGKSLSAFFGVRFIKYNDRMVIPGHLLRGLRSSYLKSNAFVPIGQSEDKVIVAMEDPNFLPSKDAIRRVIRAKEFEYCVSIKEDIHRMIDQFFDVKRTGILADSGSIEDILGQLGLGEELYDEETEGVTEEDSAIVQLVNKMIIDGYNRGASDIHIEPRQGKENALIRTRTDGVCQNYQTIPYTYKRAIVSRIKIMADLDIAERRIPQDGKIKFKRFAPLDIELRVATIPTAGQNEDVVMRILAAGEPLPLDNMGMSDKNFTAFTDMVTKPYGMVLVVGPTGSGKTTTLHAALRYINKPEVKIWTAEDPVEITQEGLRQVQVAPKIGFDFAMAMRSFLRADPDVIMVGEMRDHETMSIGIEASFTGHLVFSTLHTNSAPETITRLLDMGMDPFNFADSLLGILAQRLVRTLCKDCKEKYHPTRKEFDALVRGYDGDFDALGFEYNDDFFLYRPKGCPKCNDSGYRGRTGIHELIVCTDEMKSLIQNRAMIKELRDQAIQDGMTTLMQDGIRKVCLGYSELTQVRKVCIR
jgi:type II secretory ATPase GspE/PulE/Tfp pilus assembly ATPase PilB-like protein